jgi:hypothetical protein
MKYRHDKAELWVEKTTERLLKTLFANIEALDAPDEAITQVTNNLVAALVNRMVLDSLSLHEEEVKNQDANVLLKKVQHKFLGMKNALEQGVGEAFETGVSEAANKQTLFVCQISSVKVAKDALPC